MPCDHLANCIMYAMHDGQLIFKCLTHQPESAHASEMTKCRYAYCLNGLHELQAQLTIASMAASLA